MTGPDATKAPPIDSAKKTAAPRPRFIARMRAEPLLPEAGAGGAPLTAVIAVMSFLAVLAMAAVLVINQAANDWMSELRSELTVQIKGADAQAIATQADEALRILRATPGVIEASLISQDEAAALLEPWLGQGNASVFLNVPAIIEVKIAPELRGDLDLLRNRLAAAAPGASLDDHASWHDRLASAAHSGQAVALAVLILVLGAACAISVFAARAGLAANHEIVSLLHLVGATDEFVAAEVQRRFFILGLRGAAAGLAAALATLGLLVIAAGSDAATQSFLPDFTLGGWLILWLLAVPAAMCLVTALTARMTVLRSLRAQY